MLDRTAGADFVHLWNQIWRRVRLPKELGPPEGSFLDVMFRNFGLRAPSARMSARAVTSWFEEFNFMADVKRSADATVDLGALAQTLQRGRSAPQNDARIAELTLALHEACWQRDELLKSTSWRVTAP